MNKLFLFLIFMSFPIYALEYVDRIEIFTGKHVVIPEKNFTGIRVADESIAILKKDLLTEKLKLFAKNPGKTTLYLEPLDGRKTIEIEIIVKRKRIKLKSYPKNKEENADVSFKNSRLLPGW